MSHAMGLIHTCAIGRTFPEKHVCCLSEVHIQMGILYFIWQPKYILNSAHAHSSILGCSYLSLYPSDFLLPFKAQLNLIPPGSLPGSGVPYLVFILYLIHLVP